MSDFAKIDDYPQIINLWQSCFGDNRDYILNFLSKRATQDNCLLLKENGSVLSMLFLLEGKVKLSNKHYRSLYIYAACTSPAYRGKGFMTKLIAAAEEIAAEQGVDFICLVPANPGLFEYYSRFGFETKFIKKQIKLNRSCMNMLASETAELCRPEMKEVTDLRNSAFADDDYFLWDESAVDYSFNENESVGGSAIFVKNKGLLSGYAIYIETQESVQIKELCAINGGFGAIVKQLVDSTKCNTFIFNLPIGFPFTSDRFEVMKNGMIKAISVNGAAALPTMHNAYIGLTLE